MPIYARTSSGEYKPLDAVCAKNSSGEMVSLLVIRNQNGSVFEVRTVDSELPVTLKTNGSYIQNYKLKGKAVQSGTPTPDNPTMPDFCGMRTGNLFDFEQLKNAPSGTIESITFSHVLTMQLKANTYYTMASNGTGSVNSTPADLYRSVYFNSVTGESSVNKNNPVTVLTDSTGVVRIGFFDERTNAQQYLNGEANVWINEGSTALPYEPYGYKLDISSGGENLVDESKVTLNTYIASGGGTGISTASNLTDYIDIGALPFVLSGVRTINLMNSNTRALCYYDSNKNYISGTNYNPDVMASPVRFWNIPQNAKYVRFSFDKAFENGIMLNHGSTALPYSPYNRIATPIYLGQTQTVRKIKKLVLDGSEPWALSSSIVYISNTDTERLSPLICTHFPNVQNSGMWNGNNWICQVNISNLGMTGRDAWIAYLQQQHAAGTPVTVWYVLAEPETGIVNEPLAKIGDYADEVYVETPRLKTASGTTTVDSTLSLKPSVSLTGQIRIIE